MIVRSREAKKREFKGVAFDVLAVGQSSMVTRMNYKAGERVPPHSHANEQSGYVVSGRIRLAFGEHDETLEAGDSYSIPADVEHSVETLENATVLDFFVPPREEYL